VWLWTAEESTGHVRSDNNRDTWGISRVCMLIIVKRRRRIYMQNDTVEQKKTWKWTYVN